MYKYLSFTELYKHFNHECLQENRSYIRKNEIDKTMDPLISSDIVYFIVPNYCEFPYANYFAFNERTLGYFNNDEQLLQKYYNIKKNYIIVSNTENEIFYKVMEAAKRSAGYSVFKFQ